MTTPNLMLKFRGLMTALGDLQSPEGGMAAAQNVNFPAPGIAEKRTGIARQSVGFGGPTWEAIDSPVLTNGDVFLQTGTATQATGLKIGQGAAAATLLTLPDGNSLQNSPNAIYRAQMAESNGTHFFTSFYGTMRLAVGSTSPTYAGAPLAPGFDYWHVDNGGTGNIIVPATGGFLADGNAVAYRVVWGFNPTPGDPTSEVVGAPSGRSVIPNISGVPGYTGADATIALRVLLPRMVRCEGDVAGEKITTSYFFRVYRSFQVDYSTGNPSDEMQLCYQAYVSAGDITNGYVEFIDSCPESVLGAYLYTNQISRIEPSTVYLGAGLGPNEPGPGLAGQNDIPPQANCIASFQKCIFYGNIYPVNKIVVSLVALPVVGSILTIGARTYTAIAPTVYPTVPATGEYVVVSSGTLSENIAATALNIVEAVNRDSGQVDVWCTYVGNDAAPGTVGKFIISGRTLGGSTPVSIAASTVFIGGNTTALRASFLPQLTSSGLTGQISIQSNGLAISKPSQGDAVPPANYASVGPSTCTILAMKTLREALYIFTDQGLYWLRGTTPSSFQIDLLDPTFRLWGARGVTTVGDALYAWGREGIVEITSGGIRQLDVPIRNLVQKIETDLGYSSGRHAPNICDYFAIGYRVARRVMFFYPESSTSRNCIQALVWNMATETWSTIRFPSGKSAGTVRTVDERAFYGAWNAGSTDSWLFVDRNTGAQTDYADDDNAGDQQSIDVDLTWNKIAPNADIINRWQELTVFLSPSQVNATLAALPTSIKTTLETEIAVGVQTTVTCGAISVRQIIPRTNCMGVRMQVQVEHVIKNQYIAICGVGLLYTPMSTSATR